MKTLNIDELMTSDRAIASGGVSYPVRQITPRIGYIVDAAMKAQGEEKVKLFGDAVARLVPTMPRDEIDDLSASQILGILDFATAEVRAVEEAVADPNAPSPTSETSGVSTGT